MYQDFDLLWQSLQRSSFRAKFSLNQKDHAYLTVKGLPLILSHASDFIARRLTAVNPARDGKQTPWKGHPVFVAQHATATCCRGCLEKWHQIPRGRPMTEEEQQYVVSVISYWLDRKYRP